MPFNIEVQDQALQAAFQQLQGRLGNISPVLQAIGEDVMERTKQRFSTSTGPDGSTWKPNAPATLARYLAQRGGKLRKKGGGLNKRGQTLLANKKPLIGQSGDLMRQFHVLLAANSVTVANSMVYAAIHQFGGQAGRGHKVTIPARPFLPVTANGQLYPQDRDLILETLARYIRGAGTP